MAKPKPASDRLWLHEQNMIKAESKMIESLRVIRDNRLYRSHGYTNFADYCRREWCMEERADRFWVAPITVPSVRDQHNILNSINDSKNGKKAA